MKDTYSNEHARCTVSVPTSLPVQMQQRIREVSRVYTDAGQRRQGYATQLIKQVCDDADLDNLVLMLEASPEANTISKDKLIAWYKRFGFVKTQDKPVLMARAPTFKVRQSFVGMAVERSLRG